MLDERDFLDPCATRARIAALFAPEAVLTRIARFEAALAGVQAELDLIPAAAAEAIARGSRAWVPDTAHVRRHRTRVGHPMVAILDAFSEAIDPVGHEWLHFGATTADVFRTVLMGLLHETVQELDQAMARIETRLAALARDHRATPMMGRTLGRHALPISFGYKVAVWLTQLRRDRERLAAWATHFPSGVVSGAVGTHAAMGPMGPEVERRVLAQLGLGAPEPVDCKGSQDAFAEFGAALAIAARGLQRIAQEVFLLQGDDFGEVSIRNPAVGSSTMPHKVNPTLCVEIMSRAPEVASMLAVMLDWVVTIHERDSAIHAGTLEQMCIDFAQLLSCAEAMVQDLVVHPEAMLANLGRTRGAIMTEALTVLLAEKLGRRSAHERMREIVRRMGRDGLTLAEALAQEPDCADIPLPDPARMLGEAPALVDACLARLGYPV